MKTLKIVLLFVAALAFASACNKDENAKPSVRMSSDSIILNFNENPDQAVVFTADINAEAQIRDFVVREIKYNMEGQVVNNNLVTLENTDYRNKENWTYQFTKIYRSADFVNISKIEINIAVTDKDGNEAFGTFTITQRASSYAVVFTVHDNADNPIADAIIKLNNTTNPAGNYAFTMAPGTYAYEVSRAGYTTKTGNVTVSDRPLDVDVVLEGGNLSDWSTDQLLTLATQTSYAQYDGTRVTVSDNTVIGVRYSTNPGGELARIVKTDNCDGWVFVNDISNLRNQADLSAAYAAGSVVNEYDLPTTYHSKVYAERNFISRIGNEYLLVKYRDGVNYVNQEGGNNGNVLAFQYRK